MVTRRGFVQFCATFLAGLRTGTPAFADQPMTGFPRVKLVDEDGVNFPPSRLAAGVNYLFHYPYISTPCFLLRLERPAADDVRLATEDGRRYRWRGGAGPDRSIVAYSAICSHRMTHPAKTVSFINYRSEPVAFRDRAEEETLESGVIYCCSEHSVYDASKGARVLGGPAPQPLAAVHLEFDPAEEALYAEGVYGGTLFDRFLNEFGDRLALEFGTTAVGRLVEDEATVTRLDEYSRNLILC